MDALNVPVPEALRKQWVQWFSPAVQPFIVSVDAVDLLQQTTHVPLSAELRDTYCLYGLPEGCTIGWLTEGQFNGLPRPKRALLVRSQQLLGRQVVPKRGGLARCPGGAGT